MGGGAGVKIVGFTSSGGKKKNGLQKIEKSFASFYRSAAFIFV